MVTKHKLGELLVAGGVLAPEQLGRALNRQRELPGKPKIGEVILAMGLAEEHTILDALSALLHLESVDLAEETPTDDALAAVTAAEAEKYGILPLRFEHTGQQRRLVAAMADPTQLEAIERVQFRADVVIRPVLTTTPQLRWKIRRSYGSDENEVVRGAVISTMPGDEDRDETWVGEHPPARSTGAKPVAFLRVINGPWKGRVIPIPACASVTFGRGDDVDLTLPDLQMSRRHFLIVDTGDEVEAVDLGSRNGCTLNKVAVRKAVLKTGDYLQAGSTVFYVQHNDRS